MMNTIQIVIHKEYTSYNSKELIQLRNHYLLEINPPVLSLSMAILLPPLDRAPPQNSGPITN